MSYTTVPLFSTSLVRICVPDTPLNCRRDGGHLIVEPLRVISDRMDCGAQEAVELMAATMLAGHALKGILGVEKVNYQEMGNWSLGKTSKSKLHIHIFGRAQHQRYQQRGESIRFFPQGHPIYSVVYERLRPNEVQAMSTLISGLLDQAPYSQLLQTHTA